MRTLVFDIRICSLYSIRVPFTWQSALTYPVLPPSSIIGLLANALQRYKSQKHPLEYLKEIEQNILWAGSRLLSPCVIKSYITSAITKWEDEIGGKFTNALGRQFAYSKKIQIAVILKDDTFVEEITKAIESCPLTCGDSESCISIENSPFVFSAQIEKLQPNTEIETFFPFPYAPDRYEIHSNGAKIYLVHERCMKINKTFPLVMYLFPLKEENGILYPVGNHLKLKTEYSIISFINSERFYIVPNNHIKCKK